MNSGADATGGVFWRDTNEEVALQRYQTLVNTVSDGIYQLDTDGRFVAVNDIIVEMTGYTREEILGEHVSLVLDDEDIDRIGREIEKCLASEGELDETFEFTAQTVADETIPCELQMSLLVEDGIFKGTVGVVRDISDKKRAEETISERERQLQRERDLIDRVLQTSPIGIMVLNCDGEITRVNRRCKELLEISDVDTYTPSNREVYGEDGNPVPVGEHPFAHVLETGEPAYDRILQIALPNGDYRWLSVNAAPVFGDDGTIDRVITTGEDVTELKERERELESELHEILGRVSDAFYALDEEWQFTHVNDQAAELMQQSREELLGSEAWGVFPSAEDIYREKLRTAMEIQQSVNFEIYEEQLESWLEFNIYPSKSGLSIYFRDVTERLEYEQKLTKYETIVETVNDGIYVKDEDGHFIMVNEAYAELTGYDRDRLIGEHASLVVDEEMIEQSREIVAPTVDSTENSAVEAEIHTADGETVPAEGTFAVIQTGDGVREEVGVVRDITERKQREQALRERERNLQRYKEYTDEILDAVDDIFYLLEEAGTLQRWNKSVVDVTGYADTEIDSMNALEFFTEVDHEKIAAAIAEGFETGDTQVEAEILTKNGECIPYEFVASTLEDPDGNRVLAGVGRDITGRREYERKLRESNERLEQFAYAASHDLQEPLRMVRSYLQILESRYADELDEDAEEFIEFAVDGAERMSSMIGGLLQYSRVETKGNSFEPVDLDAIVSDVRDDLQLQIKEKDATIVAESLPEVEGDISQLRQVFQNLLDNAIEYSGDEPPLIHISAEQKGGTCVVSVQDEGVGIEPDGQERIFEVFQRMHTYDEYEGTGIGLALCKRIIERHDGDIWVESEPDKGSTFLFTLPTVTDCAT